MKKIAIACILFLSLLSCKNNDNNVQFKALEQSLTNSNLLVESNNRRIYDEMNNKLHDPQTRAKAEIWQPRAMEAKKLSSDIRAFVDHLATDLKKDASVTGHSEKANEQEKKTNELYRKLVDFKKSLIAVIKPDEYPDNPVVRKDMALKANELRKMLLTDIDDSSENGKNSKDAGAMLFAGFFEHTTTDGSLAIFEKIKNDVLIAENALISYFDNMSYAITESYEKFSAILTKNSNYFKPGETLEIYAGIGAFSTASAPKITMNGIKIPLDDDGKATYKLKINSKPGKYFIPVKIEFVKPDGSNATKIEKIEYIVSP